MCENRERLIGYVYDECDAAERREIEAHLESCHTCRHEIRGLRAVRQDLLAWDVPSTDPIWRPVAPARQESSWRLVPAWALAAAACAMFLVGAAGGAATFALMPHPAPVTQASVTTPAAIVTPAITPADLAAFEGKMLARMRAELDTHARVADVTPRDVSNDAQTNDLARRVNMLSLRQNELYDRVLEFANETQGIRAKQSGLERVFVSYALGQNGPEASGGR